MTPQELIEKQIQQEKYNIQTIIDSGMSSGEKLVLLHDLLKWNVVEILNQEIERKKGMKKEIPPYREVEGNIYTDVPITRDELIMRTTYNECLDEDIAHLTSLKELIK